MGMKAGSKEYYKAYYEKNKSTHNARSRKYKDENKEKVKEYDQDYFQKTYPQKKEKLRETWNSDAKRVRSKRAEFILEFKKDKCCSKCGEKRWYVLDLHHLDPKEKDFNIGEATKYSIKKIKSELEKCVFLCSNCHREFHHLEKEENISIKNYLET